MKRVGKLGWFMLDINCNISTTRSCVLGDAFTKRYIVERTNKEEIRTEEQSEKAESREKNLWNEIQLKGPERRKQILEQNKKE